MINIGKINKLNVVKKQGADVYLDNGTSGKVLLADKKMSANCQVGDSLEVFVYVDNRKAIWRPPPKYRWHRWMILPG